MVKEIKIDSISGVKDLAFEQTYNEDIGRSRSAFYYRGMPDVSFNLGTSLQRNCGRLYKELEQPMLDNFIKYVKIEDPAIDESIWKTMVIGRHYGLPTRLLDWTHSTLVALHFSNTEDSLKQLDKHDCVIWRIDMRDLNRNLPDKYREALDRRKTFIFSLDMLNSLASTIREYDEDMGSDSLVLMEPPSIDLRIANQYSFFTVIPSGITDLEQYLAAHTERTVKYVIDKSLRWEIRDILDEMNISERMMYPGKEGIAKWLARHYYVKEK